MVERQQYFAKVSVILTIAILKFDYDFYSSHALDKAKKLADIYVAEGFPEVEAKAGTHHGTYKVYVNFIPIADITFLHPDLFRSIEEECLQ